jgi:hypothetical protein
MKLNVHQVLLLTVVLTASSLPLAASVPQKTTPANLALKVTSALIPVSVWSVQTAERISGSDLPPVRKPTLPLSPAASGSDLPPIYKKPGTKVSLTASGSDLPPVRKPGSPGPPTATSPIA